MCCMVTSLVCNFGGFYEEMPKRKQRKVKAPPKDQLALRKDEDNTKGSKEERSRALQLFTDDFDIQGKP